MQNLATFLHLVTICGSPLEGHLGIERKKNPFRERQARADQILFRYKMRPPARPNWNGRSYAYVPGPNILR